MVFFGDFNSSKPNELALIVEENKVWFWRFVDINTEGYADRAFEDLIPEFYPSDQLKIRGLSIY